MQQVMRSFAYDEYLSGWREVIEMVRTAPTGNELLRSHRRVNVANALYKGSVVLLSSHLERYIESLVAEAIDVINSASLQNNLVPEPLRMIHVEQPLSSVSSKWIIRHTEKTETKQIHQKKIDELKTVLANCHAYFGDDQICGQLRSDILIDDFANPLPDRIIQLFRFFGINNVVGKAISLDTKPDRGIIDKKVEELVRKRNSIAHTGVTTDLTREDVITYLICSRRLVRGMDIVVGQTIQQIANVWPWLRSRSLSTI